MKSRCRAAELALVVAVAGMAMGGTSSAQTSTVSLGTMPSSAQERPLAIRYFRIVRSNVNTNLELTVNYSMSGSASNGVDYELLPGSTSFSPGIRTNDVALIPKPDLLTTEGSETAILTLVGGDYVVGSPSNKTITIQDSTIAYDLLWGNNSGDRLWNVTRATSTNWPSAANDYKFFPLDRVEFANVTAPVAGRIFVGEATWDAGANVFSNQVPADVTPVSMAVNSGSASYEFEGGQILTNVSIQGGILVDREVTNRTRFGSGSIAMSGSGSFWRQVPGATNPILQVCDNTFQITGVNTLMGSAGTNEWQGAVDLGGRLQVGSTTFASRSDHVFTGTLTVNQATNNPSQRVFSVRAGSGGGITSINGPIVDSASGTNRLWLESGSGSAELELRGTNTYAGGTVVTAVTNVGGVSVMAGSSLGSGPLEVSNGRLTLLAGAVGIATNVTVSGAGAQFNVYAANGVVSPSPIAVSAGAQLNVYAAAGVTAPAIIVSNSATLNVVSNGTIAGPLTVTAGSTGVVAVANGLTGSLTVGGIGSRVILTNNALVNAGDAVTVDAGGLLVLQGSNCIPDNGGLRLNGTGSVSNSVGVEESLTLLWVNGTNMPAGTYGNSQLPANIRPGGTLKVRGPMPSGFRLLVR